MASSPTTKLKSKTARAALKPRREPYWHCLTVGVYVGYRRSAEGAGTWISRKLQQGSKKYLLHSLGALPDVAMEDQFDEAAKLTQAWAGGVAAGVTHRAVTVADACRAYVKHQKTHKSAANSEDAEGRFRRLVYSDPIGAVQLERLRTTLVRDWLNAQLDDDGDEDDLRRSKDSANRNLTALKAALNLARDDKLVLDDRGWKTVGRFASVGKRRERFLTQADRTKLLANCEPDLAALVTTLLLTAVRPGEIAAADVDDFNPKQGTLQLSGKTGARVVTLSTTAQKFLAAQVGEKPGDAPLLTDSFENRWNKDSWKKGFKLAVRAAKLPEDVVLYSIRHAAISEMIAGGVDAFTVARLSGTSTTMIDKHYGHLRHEQTRDRLDAVKLI
jgi:integrase